MSNRNKIRTCYTALSLAILFLVIGVDYMPHMVAWLPMIITFYFAFRCKAFFVHINQLLDKIIPLE